MTYRNGNYTAFYVDEPFSESHLGAAATADFCYYNLLRAWEARESDFKFNDSHMKNYNVRDGSDWEKTLKPRLHERLKNSKNIILFLSSITKNSRALREEMNYGINVCGLPVIVIYPDYKYRTDIASIRGIEHHIKSMWDKLPVFRDSMWKVATLHIPLDRSLIKNALNDEDFMVNTMTEADAYYYSIS